MNLNSINRRNFLQSLGLIAAGSSPFGFSPFRAAEAYLTFDFHSHPGMFLKKNTPGYPGDDGLIETLGEIKSSHLTGAFFALVADAALIEMGPTGVAKSRSYQPKEAWGEYQRQIRILKKVIAENNFRTGLKGADLEKAYKQQQTAAFIAVEGGDFLGGDAGLLSEMYNDGVRSMQVVHYHPNELGNLQTSAPMHDGLSAAGKEVVRKMNKLHMVIDVAHVAEDTVKAIADITDAPVILSHTMLKISDDRPLAKRTISVEHAKMVANTGGVIGAWPSGFSGSFDDFLTNTLRLVDAVGVDHVGLGTDMDGNFKPVFSSYLQLPAWIDGLKSKGISDGDVKKIAGGNALSVLKKVLV